MGEANGTERPRITATYDYTDEGGKLLYQAVRFEPKNFKQRRPVGKGQWTWSLGDAPRVLYRLPELLASPKDALVFLPEGEKDVDNLVKIGCIATTCAMGAGKWRPEYNEPLRGRNVCILPDNDPPGQKHAQAVSNALRSVAKSATILELPGLPEKGDVSDWLAADKGNDKLALLKLAEEAAKRQDAKPEPETDEGQEIPWESFIPLGEIPHVQDFPLSVFPEPLANLAEEIAFAVNCPPDAAALPLLALAGGVIANSRHLAITSTHVQSPCLYAAYVSRPGTGKSPPLKLLRRPIDLAQHRYLDQYKAAMKAWDDLKEDPTRGQRPIARRCIVSNTTTESLCATLHENPRGVVMVTNELSGVVTGLNQYKGGKGNDRQIYLDLWDGTTVLNDRKSDRERQGMPAYILDSFLAIIGTLQPSVIDCLRGEPRVRSRPNDDGFLDRFLFSYPPELPAVGEQWRDVSDGARDAWANVVERLLTLSMAVDGDRTYPVRVRLTPCGRQAWERFTHALAAEINQPDFPEHLFGPWQKLRGYAGRLALIVHYLRWATDEAEAEDVDGESMTRAAQLVSYFKSHARKVYAALDADPLIPKAKKVERWIRREQRARFSKRDAHYAFRGTFKSVDELEPVLGVLLKHGLIRPEPTKPKTSAGRPASPMYESHPDVLYAHGHNEHNAQNPPNSGSSVHSVHSVRPYREREPGEEG
jgi:hypothetical protein